MLLYLHHMKIHDIIEARRNPDQNPKTSINSYLIKRLKNTRDYIETGSGDSYPNLFVSFTKVDKLGINPQSKYDTPLGIYSFPVKYVVDMAGEEEAMTALPFAGKSPWANVFEASGTILDISNMSRNEFKELTHPLVDALASIVGDSDEAAEEIEDFITSSKSEAIVDSVGGRFWYITMKVAETVAQIKSTKLSTAWNWVFRRCGIDGVIDLGDGIIHTNEPTQMVLFSMENVNHLERVKNAYSPSIVDNSEYDGARRKRDLPAIKNFIAAANGDVNLLEHLLAHWGWGYFSLIKNPETRVNILSNPMNARAAVANKVRLFPSDQSAIIDSVTGQQGAYSLRLHALLELMGIKNLDIDTVSKKINQLGDIPDFYYTVAYLTKSFTELGLHQKLIDLYKRVDFSNADLEKLKKYTKMPSVVDRYLRNSGKV